MNNTGEIGLWVVIRNHEGEWVVLRNHEGEVMTTLSERIP